MAVLKSSEILANSTSSWEDAVQTAVSRMAKTVRNVRSANVENFSCTVEDGKISEYRVICHVTFEVD